MEDVKMKPVEIVNEDFEKAQEVVKTSPELAVPLYRRAIFQEDPDNEQVKIRENAIYGLGKAYVSLGRATELRELLTELKPFFEQVSKAKTAKIVRKIIDLIGLIPNCAPLQVELCEEVIEWCKREKRTMLRQRLESRLASYKLDLKQYKEALLIISELIYQVKKIDDKLLLVEIQLVESRVYHLLKNVPKARASLTSARASANAIYCPPSLQAEIDRQAGILCSEEKDFKTAFSYFYEAYEGYNTIDSPSSAEQMLKYMILSKIMINASTDVYSIINGKAGIKYAGPAIEAMRAVQKAQEARSLKEFEKVWKEHKEQLADDALISSHLNGLYENLLEQNLIRIIEPFSVVQLTHVATLIDLPDTQVESKLSEMILDKKLQGILDQGAGNLIVYDEVVPDKTYEEALGTVKQLNHVVDRLYEKANRISAR